MEPFVSALSDWTSLVSVVFIFVCSNVLTSNRRYARHSSFSFGHYDETLNERADINEASLSPFAKSRAVHPVRGAQREILVEISSTDCALVNQFDVPTRGQGFD